MIGQALGHYRIVEKIGEGSAGETDSAGSHGRSSLRKGKRAMEKVLVGYYSRTGNTAKMAKIVADALKKEGIEVDLRTVDQIKAADLLGFDGIVLGGPTYYGGPPAAIKELLDESVRHHGKLDGKIGGAFTSSANVGGGNETAVLDILQAMLIHGMIVQGDPEGDHYGPVAIQAPDARAKANCIRFAKRLASLVKRTAAG